MRTLSVSKPRSTLHHGKCTYAIKKKVFKQDDLKSSCIEYPLSFNKATQRINA